MSFQFNFALETPSSKPSGDIARGPTSQSTTQHTREGTRFVWSCASHPQVAAAFNFTPLVVPVEAGPERTPLRFEIVTTTDEAFLARTGAIQSILTSSDVQTGVYEGGFKLWECTIDLVQYLDAITCGPNAQYVFPPRVLELGCGHGLPGIMALQRGARQVTFSDYNKEVLELATCPNVYRNVGGDTSLINRCSFYAGAWHSMAEFMEREETLSREEMQYDVILTAETVYTEAVALELYEAIKRHLKRGPNSRAYVAAKKYYFGTGGGVDFFASLVNQENLFNVETVWEELNGRSNIRVILLVTFA